jgi:YHS domain-containing protein
MDNSQIDVNKKRGNKMKSELIILSAVVLMFSVGQVFAGEGHEKGSHKDSMPKKEMSSDAVNIGNKICPVSGEEIGGAMGEGVQVEYDGKIYNLCCTMCAKDFKKDPAKFIMKINEELENSEYEEHVEHEEEKNHDDSRGSHEEKRDHSVHDH